MKNFLIDTLKFIALITLITAAGFMLDGITYFFENINGDEPWPWLFSLFALVIDAMILGLVAIGAFITAFERLTK